ncbi:hypothetical protein L596_027141 [Steinernema carpocapsae]|uniref:Uncharacterized protein n=1 Tax=Steinernema carpocapsae TaxID=34508 RepID=A0A4V5ZYD5_STECR|nr:hypothetical protein L596_027141 [Steinernema carpocapsae]
MWSLLPVLLLATVSIASIVDVHIMPVYGSRSWRYALRVDERLDGKTLKDLPKGSKVRAVYFTEMSHDVKWKIISRHEAVNEFSRFLVKNMAKNATIHLLFDLSPEAYAIALSLMQGLNHLEFADLATAYYLDLGENFVRHQIDAANLQKLSLVGEWPSSVVSLLKTYIRHTAKPSFTVSFKTLMKIDEELVKLVLDKFVQNKISMSALYGTLTVDVKTLKGMKPELITSVKNAKNEETLFWKMPKNGKRLGININGNGKSMLFVDEEPRDEE